MDYHIYFQTENRESVQFKNSQNLLKKEYPSLRVGSHKKKNFFCIHHSQKLTMTQDFLPRHGFNLCLELREFKEISVGKVLLFPGV